LKQLQNTLQKSSFAGSSKSVEIEAKVDPNILGGLVIESGDKTIDLSVSSKVAKLNRLLTQAV
jgi:F-type H+-transporting ATPase subunit O